MRHDSGTLGVKLQIRCDCQGLFLYGSWCTKLSTTLLSDRILVVFDIEISRSIQTLDGYSNKSFVFYDVTQFALD